MARLLLRRARVNTYRPLRPLFDLSGNHLAPAPCPAAFEPARRTVDGEALITDERFDALLDPKWRPFSDGHWTPARVAAYAALLLAPAANEQVLDIGSGVGKFCVVGALTTQGTFVGVEQRAHLVTAAEEAAACAGADRARFVAADAFSLDWTAFTALYFFNPFVEAKYQDDDQIDDTIEFGIGRYNACLAKTVEKLSGMPPGTRVAIYYALGTPMPPGYVLLWEDWMGEGRLSLWLRT